MEPNGNAVDTITKNVEVYVPRDFLTDRLPYITDPTELHVTLAVYRLVSLSVATPPVVSEDTVLRDNVLAKTFPEDRKSSQLAQRVRRGLQYAVARESLIQIVVTSDDHEDRWYVPDTTTYRAELAKALEQPGQWPEAGTLALVITAAPSVFSLYERNIGMLTPLLTDQIGTAMELYPLNWLEDAIGEAVLYNKRNWRYIQRVLENWATNGRGDTPPKGKQHEANWRGAPEPFDPALYKQRRRTSKA